jgi:hypothetical protein
MPSVRRPFYRSIDALAEESATPIVQVFTDALSSDEKDVEGRDLIGANVGITLAIEIACVTRAPAEDGKGQVIVIPQTDEGMEMTIDLVHRQTFVELQAANTTWGKLWRDFVLNVRSLSAERGSSGEKGVRFAARRIEIKLETVSDPVPGAPVSGVWVDILAAFAADPELGPLVPALRAAAEGEPLADWRRAQAELGLALSGIRAIGISPIFETNEDAVPIASEATWDDADRNEAIAVDSEQATIAEGEGQPLTLVEVPQDG